MKTTLIREDDWILVWGTISVILIGIFCAVVLNPVHKKNIERLPAQHYTLKSSDPIWFYKPDEIGWTKGEVLYLWGYYPVIFSEDLKKTFQFNEVEWMIGNE
jgi:hypothetical protein